MKIAARILLLVGWLVFAAWFGATRDNWAGGFVFGSFCWTLNSFVSGILKAHRDSRAGKPAKILIWRRPN